VKVDAALFAYFNIMDLFKALEATLPKKSATTQVVENGNSIRISYVAHWRAWTAYNRLFPGQTCERLEERGGFAEQELNAFYPEWRNHIIVE
jgi:hypothetical protein